MQFNYTITPKVVGQITQNYSFIPPHVEPTQMIDWVGSIDVLSRLTFRLLKQALDEKIIERYERNRATFYRAPSESSPPSYICPPLRGT